MSSPTSETSCETPTQAEIYDGLGLRLTYQPAQQIVRAEADLDPDNRGVVVRVRGGIDTTTQPGFLTFSDDLPLNCPVE